MTKTFQQNYNLIEKLGPKPQIYNLINTNTVNKDEINEFPELAITDEVKYYYRKPDTSFSFSDHVCKVTNDFNNSYKANDTQMWKLLMDTWEQFILHIPKYSELEDGDAELGLEFMNLIAGKVTPEETGNSFDDSFPYSLCVFNLFITWLVLNRNSNIDNYINLYPALFKEYDFILTDCQFGFPESLPFIVLHKSKL